MTEKEYWDDYALIRDDVASAQSAFHTSETLEALARDKAMLRTMNEEADYWILHRYSLTLTFFIVLGRLFDDGPDTHSVHKLLKATVENPEFFSNSAMRRRKLGPEPVEGGDPEWLKEFMNNEPSKASLGAFKQSVTPYSAKYKSVYQPIRSKIIAHTIFKDHGLKSKLFTKTHVDDLDKILRCLHNVVMGIWELAYNDVKPDIAGDYGYDERVSQIRTQGEKIIRRSIESSPNRCLPPTRIVRPPS